MKRAHLLCAVFGVVTVLLVVLDAGAWAFIPTAGCAATCLPMVYGMVRGAHQPTRHA